MATIHALQRASDRLGIELPASVVRDIVAGSDIIAGTCKVDTAVRVWRLRSMVGQAWSDTSNGDIIVAIIRDGIVRTFMFRRSTQPHTPEAYRVIEVRG